MPFAHKTKAAGQAGAAGLKEATAAAGGRSRRPAFNPRTSLWRPAALGAALALGLASLSAHAATLRLGNVDVQIDTTVSVGVQIRQEGRETDLLPARNGGRPDETEGADLIILGGVQAAIMAGASATAAQTGLLTAFQAGTFNCGTASNPSAYARGAGSHCVFNNNVSNRGTADPSDDTFIIEEQYNYDGSINTDDGRLNFDDGDLTGGTFKATSEIQADMGNLTFFSRVNLFYDAVMDDEGSFERSGLRDNADAAVVTDIDMLDFYLDYNGAIGDNPLLIRAGRQVINWGEATFLLGGNSVFSPIDVPAIRRPGAEIEDALLPVEALYASVALPYDLSVEAYVGGWDNFRIDNGGTPFANSDGFEATSAGNGPRSYVGAGAFSGDGRRNCSDPAAMSNATSRLYATATNNVFGACETDSLLHFSVPNEAGNVEASRQQIRSTVVEGRDEAGYVVEESGFLARGSDDEPDDFGNDFGIALRWYSERLNSTEFGFYYQNYTSRIPYASTIARRPFAGPNVTTPTSSSVIRGAALQGCALAYMATGGTGFERPHTGSSVRLSQSLESIQVNDPSGLGAEIREGIYAVAANRDIVTASAAAGLQAQLTSLATTFVSASATVQATVRGGASALTPGATQANMNTIVAAALDKEDSSMGQAADLGCLGLFAQATAGAQTPTGAVTAATRYVTEVVAEYPEDIEVFGFSFNTTIGGWGVQAEIAHRPDMPLQLDTDALAITALAASCAWENFAAVADVYYDLQTIESTCGDFDQIFHGYVEEEVLFFDIGTTATFTRSNPLIAALGADLGILLTELGYMSVPGAEDYTVSNNDALANGIPRLQNLCTSGSDLPLGGVFSLDPRGPLTATNVLDPTQPTEMCRPTEESSGIVLFGQLQYNNAFGTAWGLRPTFAYARGIDGRSPSPAGSFIEDNESMSLALNADYQSEWTVSLSYTAFDGDVLYNRNVDRDFISLSTSYAF